MPENNVKMWCLLFPPGWLCDRVCGRGDRLRGVPAANQTRPWKSRDQLLHAHPHQGNISDTETLFRGEPSTKHLFKPWCLNVRFSPIGSCDRRRPERKLVAVYEPQLQPKLWNAEVDGERRCSHRTLRPLWYRGWWVHMETRRACLHIFCYQYNTCTRSKLDGPFDVNLVPCRHGADVQLQPALCGQQEIVLSLWIRQLLWIPRGAADGEDFCLTSPWIQF